MSYQWPEDKPRNVQGQPDDVAPSPTPNYNTQPEEAPKDTAEDLIRRFYTGGLPREEFEARMKAIGASLDDVLIEEQRIINPDPEQPGADAARKYPGKAHKLADVDE